MGVRGAGPIGDAHAVLGMRRRDALGSGNQGHDDGRVRLRTSFVGVLCLLGSRAAHGVRSRHDTETNSAGRTDQSVSAEPTQSVSAKPTQGVPAERSAAMPVEPTEAIPVELTEPVPVALTQTKPIEPIQALPVNQKRVAVEPTQAKQPHPALPPAMVKTNAWAKAMDEKLRNFKNGQRPRKRPQVRPRDLHSSIATGITSPIRSLPLQHPPQHRTM